MNKEELIVNVQKLADRWGLDDLKKQELKIFEEFGELCKAELENDIEELRDAVGDVLITILLHGRIEYDRIYNEEEIDQVVTNISKLHLADIKKLDIDTTKAFDYIAVTLAEIIQKNKINPWRCLMTEYEKVSKRKGKTVNGTFIKNK